MNFFLSSGAVCVCVFLSFGRRVLFDLLIVLSLKIPFLKNKEKEKRDQNKMNNIDIHQRPVRDRETYSSSKSRKTFFGTYARVEDGGGTKKRLDPIVRKMALKVSTQTQKNKKRVVPDSIKRNTYWGSKPMDQSCEVKDLKTTCRETVSDAKRKARERIRKMELEKKALDLEAERTVRKELCEKNGASHKKFLRKMLMESVRAEERRREILASTPKSQRENLEKLFAKDRRKEQALITRIYDDLSYFIDPERPTKVQREKQKKKNLSRRKKPSIMPMGL